MEPPWIGGTKVYSRHLGHMTKMVATPIYGKNPTKNLLFQSRWTDLHETWYAGTGTTVNYSLFKWWPWGELDLFYGKVIFYLGFSIGKVKTVDFSEIIAPSDLKEGRSRHLIEFMSIESKSHFWPWPKVMYIQIFKPDFLRNYCAVRN